MTVSALFKNSWFIIKNNRFIWAIALVAALLELGIMATWNQNVATIPFGLLFIGIPIIVIDGAMIYAIGSIAQKKPMNLVNATMFGLVSVGQLVMVKSLIYILLAFFFMVFFSLLGAILPSLIETRSLALIPMTVLWVILVVLNQLISAFAFSGLMLDTYGIGDVLENTGTLLKRTFGRILPIIAIFVIIDVLLLGILISTEAITYDSAFQVSVEEVLLNRPNRAYFDHEPAVNRSLPGDYLTINRIPSMFMSSGWKARPGDVVSIGHPVVENLAIGAGVLLIQALLLPFKYAPIVLLYLEDQPKLGMKPVGLEPTV